MSDENFKCVWNMKDVSCAGNIEEVTIFNGQVSVPICEEHLKHHKIVLALYYAGKDIKKVLRLSPNERIKMVQDMGLSLDKI